MRMAIDATRAHDNLDRPERWERRYKYKSRDRHDLVLHTQSQRVCREYGQFAGRTSDRVSSCLRLVYSCAVHGRCYGSTTDRRCRARCTDSPDRADTRSDHGARAWPTRHTIARICRCMLRSAPDCISVSPPVCDVRLRAHSTRTGAQRLARFRHTCMARDPESGSATVQRSPVPGRRRRRCGIGLGGCESGHCGERGARHTTAGEHLSPYLVHAPAGRDV